MLFIQDNLETIMRHLNQIDADSKPLWGTMTAQRMIEHLTDGILSGIGKIEMTCPYEGEKLERSRAFLMSEQPMPREFKAHFVKDDAPLKHDDFEDAIDAFVDAWLELEEYNELNPNATHVHPVFGLLNQSEWRWMHRKHITHHFQQFGIEIAEATGDEEE
jgi:hypothetical protein